MIGIKITIGGKALKALFDTRAIYHADQCKELEMEMMRLIQKTIHPTIADSRPKHREVELETESIQSQKNMHEAYAKRMQTCAGYLDVTKTHTLDANDLEALGMAWRIE